MKRCFKHHFDCAWIHEV